MAAKAGIWVLPLEDDREPFPFIATDFVEIHPRFSPDGKWIAYTSDESGRSEVYVRPFDEEPATRWQVSTDGGSLVMEIAKRSLKYSSGGLYGWGIMEVIFLDVRI